MKEGKRERERKEGEEKLREEEREREGKREREGPEPSRGPRDGLLGVELDGCREVVEGINLGHQLVSVFWFQLQG